MSKSVFSFNVDKDLVKKIRHIAVDKEMSASELTCKIFEKVVEDEKIIEEIFKEDE